MLVDQPYDQSALVELSPTLLQGLSRILEGEDARTVEPTISTG